MRGQSLHFTNRSLVADLQSRGIGVQRVTLHVGPGTFLPVKAEDTSDHHARTQAGWGTVAAEQRRHHSTRRGAQAYIVASGLHVAPPHRKRRRARRMARSEGEYSGETDLFITPGYRFPRNRCDADQFPLTASPRSLCWSRRLQPLHRGLCTLLIPCTRSGSRIPVYSTAMRCACCSDLTLHAPPPFSFRLTATDGVARAGEMTTAHGVVHTPCFMPVGTQASVKGVHHDDVRAAGTGLPPSPTSYHLMLRLRAERVGGAWRPAHLHAHGLVPILQIPAAFR